MRVFSALSLALLLFPLTASAEVPTEIDTTRTTPVELRYAFSRGASQAYVMEASIQGEALDTGNRYPAWERSITLPFSYEIQSVSPSQEALVATSLSTPSLQIRSEGRAQDASGDLARIRAARLTNTVGPAGIVGDTNLSTHEGSSADITEWIRELLKHHRPQFPLEPILPGDSWLESINRSDGDLVTSTTIRYTLVGFARHATGEVAVIEATYTTSIEGQVTTEGAYTQRAVGRGNGSGTFLISVQSGQLIEFNYQNGVVLTTSTHTGHRSMSAYNEQATIRAQIVLPTLAE